MESPKQSDLLTAGGRIFCARCQARSKRHGGQCGAPAERGKHPSADFMVLAAQGLEQRQAARNAPRQG
jgi:hypothetical protein